MKVYKFGGASVRVDAVLFGYAMAFGGFLERLRRRAGLADDAALADGPTAGAYAARVDTRGIGDAERLRRLLE